MSTSMRLIASLPHIPSRIYRPLAHQCRSTCARSLRTFNTLSSQHRRTWTHLSRCFSSTPTSTPTSTETPTSQNKDSIPNPTEKDTTKPTENTKTDKQNNHNQSNTDTNNKKKDTKSKFFLESPISWRSVTLLVIVGSGLVAYYQYTRERSMIEVRPVKTIGKAQLGGPFVLQDENGKTVTSDDLKGNYALLYFGFTFCPDICPTELRKMEKALQIMRSLPNMPPITPVFISIDPRRDTPTRLKEYKKTWDPKFLWLTGTNEQVGAVAKAYRVYFSAPELAPGLEDDYLVDHSIFFYLLDKNGDFLDVYGKNLSAEEVALKMQTVINEEQHA